MNRQLQTLAMWASQMAEQDPDVGARPLWGQISSEVKAYLDEEDRTPGVGAVPFDFGGPA